LLDRMEFIRLSGYTRNEKDHIAVRYLVPKQLKVNGIKEGELAIAELHSRHRGYYTREAGVRSLSARFQDLRKAVKALLLKKQRTKLTVTSRQIWKKYLGVRVSVLASR